MKLIYWVILFIVLASIILAYFIMRKYLLDNNTVSVGDEFLGGAKKPNKKSSKKSNKKVIKKMSCDLVGTKLAGNGGSETIILVTNDKKVYKIFPNFTYKTNTDEKEIADYHLEKYDKEIKACRRLTEEFLDTKLTPHIVRYIGEFYCDDPQKLFDDCPKPYANYLDTAKNKTHCGHYYEQHPVRTLHKNVKY